MNQKSQIFLINRTGGNITQAKWKRKKKVPKFKLTPPAQINSRWHISGS